MTQSATEGDPTTQNQTAERTILSKLEIALVALLSLAWIVFHVRFFLHAGALWRDEVNSVNLSNSPHISDIWHNLQYDSFPMLWHLVLRTWIRIGIGSTDRGIRVLGLLAGLGVLAAILFNARQFRTRPIIALTLLGFSTAVICYGGSIRGYGLGLMLELFTFGLMWKVATRPTALNVASALLVALASVHMLFYNSIILAAVCCGAIAVSALHRQWKRAGIVVAIGFICAASMRIYAPAIHRADSFRAMLLQTPSSFWLLHKFAEAVSYDAANRLQASLFNLLAWELTVLLAFVLGASALLSKTCRATHSFRRDIVVYHLTILAVGLLGYIWFLWRLSYYMQPWYYLALMALLAVCCDGIIQSAQTRILHRLIPIGTIAFCAVTAAFVWADAGLRKTSIDAQAQILRQISKEGDLLIVEPWYFAVPLQRYFNGPADYATVPPVDFLVYHKYDLLIPSMQNSRVMDPTIARIERTLRSGHTVFLLTAYLYPAHDQKYPTIDAPPPDNGLGWIDHKYYDVWQRQLSFVLVRHALRSEAIPTPYAGVSDYERPLLYSISGWTDVPASTSQPVPSALSD
jgi:hypothetical protein